MFGSCSWAGNAFAPDDSKNICALLLQVASEMDPMTLAWPVGKEVFSQCLLRLPEGNTLSLCNSLP